MSGRLEWFKHNWSSVVTLTCIIAVAMVETLQETLTHTPSLGVSLGGAWNYVPSLLLIIAGVSWLMGRIRLGMPESTKQRGDYAAMLALASKYSAERDALKDQVAERDRTIDELEQKLRKIKRPK